MGESFNSYEGVRKDKFGMFDQGPAYSGSACFGASVLCFGFYMSVRDISGSTF